MSKVKTNTNNPDELTLKNEILGLVFLILAIFVLFSLISYAPYDRSFFHVTTEKTVNNFCGPVGAQVAAFLYNLFGYASYIVMVYIFFISVYFMVNKKIRNIVSKSTGYLLFLFSFAALTSTINPFIELRGVSIKAGGIFGFFISGFFKSKINGFFSAVLFLLFIFISLVMIAKLSLRKTVNLLSNLTRLIWQKLKTFAEDQKEKYNKRKRIKKIQQKYQKETEPKILDRAEMKVFREKRKIARQPSKIPEEASLFSRNEDGIKTKIKRRLPPLTYLDAFNEMGKIDFEELEEKKNELEKRLEEFKIRGKIVEYTPGPVITTYEFIPDIGIKVKEVTNMAEDLALVAKAQYVRIERILGKKAIGIEIPNKKREIINLREILSSEEYKQSTSPLTIGLGKTKSGEIFITDLQEMPHLIIAGATGSGKSVAIHTILLSILYKSTSEEVKFILIDPKRVELAIYNSLPHLLTPVVVNTKLAKNALDWVVYEMEIRYKKLFSLQVRNVEQFNKKLELMIQSEDENLEKLENIDKLPYIVVIIDEFADLMMECSREIEDNVAKLAHKARAVGIHLILATQRPSIDVITGTIKNNFPSRIAMAVPSKHDSRTIIDVIGAEKLLGHGDMLFLPPKTATLIRLHCAYVSEEEALRVVNYLSKLEKPHYNTQIVKPKAKDKKKIADKDLDAMFYDAAKLIVSSGHASASFLQRKMSIGYARAGRLIDQLQARGVVSSPNNKNERRILMSLNQLEEIEYQNE